MNTYTQRRLDPLDLQEEDVEAEDLAHALSMLCRGGGHLDRFYSVAQHSLNCALEAKARGESKRVVLACLLHDASEAYISDIIRPVKKRLPEYYEIEDQILQTVFRRFGLGDLTQEETAAWKQIDNDLLAVEMEEMFPAFHPEKIPVLQSDPDLTEREHKQIERQFLQMLEQLR